MLFRSSIFLKKFQQYKLFNEFIKRLYSEEDQRNDLNNLYDNYLKSNFIFSNKDKALLDLYSLSMTLLYIFYNNNSQIKNSNYILEFIKTILKPSIIFNNSKRMTIDEIIKQIKILNMKYQEVLEVQ